VDIQAYRSLVNRAARVMQQALRSGQLDRQPCNICGDAKSEGHHKDYRYPLAVTWLCKKHHKAEHKNKSHSFQWLGDDSFEPKPIAWGVAYGFPRCARGLQR
jgi:hypothetical protein